MSAQGYNKTSIIYHWVAAFLIIALYISGEGERDGFVYAFHISIGVIGSIFLLWRVLRRLVRGMPEKSSQSELLNRISKAVILGFLFLMVATPATGYLIIWLLGKPIEIFGLLALPSPFGNNHALHEIAEEVHEIIASLILILLVLHVGGTLKHLIIDRDGVAARMFKAVSGGK